MLLFFPRYLLNCLHAFDAIFYSFERPIVEAQERTIELAKNSF